MCLFRYTGAPMVSSSNCSFPSIIGRVNTTINITCNVTTTPTTDIEWLQNGRPLSLLNHSYSVSNEDQLLSVVINQGGESVFTCVANNSLGNVSSSVLLQVLGTCTYNYIKCARHVHVYSVHECVNKNYICVKIK